MTTVAVVGAGSWGTAVAGLCHRGASVVLWARRPAIAEEVGRHHTNAAYLPGYCLPGTVRATSDLEEAVSGADVLVVGVPSHGLRAVLTAAAPFVADGTPVVSLAKGVEQGTLLRMTEVVGEVLPASPAGVLTGPNLAKEVAAGQPAASVVAFSDLDLAEQLMGVFGTPMFRVYTNDDVVGCELAGALKNVVAIAVGMAHGMGFGDNTKASLITRGLAELSRIGVALGGRPLTFSGLAGLGDLVATCSSPQSRNRTVGIALGEGATIGQVVADMKMVAEGVKTSQAVVELGRGLGLDLPIAEAVAGVCHDGWTATDALKSLLARGTGFEQDGIIESPRAAGPSAPVVPAAGR
ncbi:MAG: NAD(P)H-dependent glycerol-3-phosphate dehydrogenase [Acidimicrobiales bacterium]